MERFEVNSAPAHSAYRRPLSELNVQRRWSSSRDDLAHDFYGPCLSRSVAYDRAVGFFRSSFLVIAGLSVAEFAFRGGCIRLVCSPNLVGDDIDAIRRGYDQRRLIDEALLRDLEWVLANALNRSAVELLATLVATGHLDIRIAFRPNSGSIFHDKVGIFLDAQGNRVSFVGSLNDSLTGWHQEGNHESFHAFCSWSPDLAHVIEDVAEFESVWANQEPGLEVIPFPDVAKERLLAHAAVDGLGGIVARFRSDWRPPSTETVSLRPHQTLALEKWYAASNHGIIEHATGTGKTVIGLAAAVKWMAEGKPALIVVPTTVLLDQWYEASRARLDAAIPILRVGAGHDSWRGPGSVRAFTRQGAGPRLIMGTIATISSPDFLAAVVEGEHLLVVIDEVHNAGAPSRSAILGLNAGGRLGLSATPVRAGDPDGTRKVMDYFGGVVSKLSLADAMQANLLSRYAYYIHPIELTAAEAASWIDLTRRVGLAFARTKGLVEEGSSDSLKRLFIQRARIAKGAANKLPLVTDVLRKHYQPGEAWLIYCDTQAQLRRVIAAGSVDGFVMSDYHSGMAGSRKETLERFADVGGIMVAIRCLDEGVDIPRVTHALILASSRNPREFIQRRGRILRKEEHKAFATIHDAIVMPNHDSMQDEFSGVRGEVARALLFSEDAINKDTEFEVRNWAREAGFDLSVAAAEGVE